MAEDLVRQQTRRRVYFILLVTSGTLLALLAVVLPLLSSTLTPPPQAGEVAGQDYRAPEAITYESEVLTQQRSDAAERAVAPVYSSPDTRVARQQAERLRTALAYISSVRADAYASSNQKLSDLAALEDVQLSQETANTILEMTDSRWQAVQQEVILVLEKVMSSPIRSDGIEAARERTPALVSLSLPENQASVVAELAAAYVTANSQYSEALTQAEREAARQAVTPVSRTLISGQTIILRGQVFKPEDIEALEQLGLVQPEKIWPDMVSATALVLLLAAFLTIYFRRGGVKLQGEARGVALMVLLFLAFAFAARLTIPARTVIPYAFPLAAYGLTVTALFGTELALITSLPLAILVAYGLPNALDLTLYYVMSSLFGVLALGRARRMVSFFWAGIAVALSASVIVIVYRLPQPTTDAIGLATLTGAAFFNGLASASITILFQFALAQFLGMTTPMQLVDLTRPDHPLLQLLLRDAPGTYQHSLQVANLAEQAAERIGGDPLLIRVGALYHDVGKSLNPVFFIENQMPGMMNPHDILSPLESAEIIIRHVADGLELGRRYRLPPRILDFISEHHGTMITRYQYVLAVKAAGGDEGQVDAEGFRYPGPRPQSRETATLMLADGSEARVRAERPTDEEELRKMVQEVVSDRVTKGQLDDTNLTLQDLSVIVDSFTATLRGIYHPRLKYPKLETAVAEAIEQSTTPRKADTTADLPSPERYR
ncbi:MAG: HDIG domain-containing metalloprotein [Chloroflexota bacterium]